MQTSTPRIEETMDIAYLFPGQGAQTPGYLARLPAHAAVTATLDEASSLLGDDVRKRDTEAALASTVNVQITGLVAAVAVSRALSAMGVEPDAVAGLSSGAFSAAVACGVLSFEQALPLIKQRAELMQQAYPQGYGLAALVGLDEAQVTRLVAQIHTPQMPLYIANLNARTQVVLAGSNSALDQATAAARQAGARRAERMAVSVPSHCALMDSVAGALKTTLAKLCLSAPRVPYISNVRARLLTDVESIREDLASNVAHTVRWHDSMTVLYEMGVRTLIEFPPGKTLTGIAHETFDDVHARAISDTPLETVAYLVEHVRASKA